MRRALRTLMFVIGEVGGHDHEEGDNGEEDVDASAAQGCRSI